MEKATAAVVEAGSFEQDPAIPATCYLSEVSSMQVDEERVLTISVGPQGSLLIWYPEDAVHLQQTYNIQGCSVGLYPRVPVQDTFLSLPMQLMPEGAAYLRDTNRARFVDANGLAKIPSLAEGIAFADVRQEQFQQQAELYEKLYAFHLDCHKAQLYQMYFPELQQAFVKNGSVIPETEEETWKIIRTKLVEQYDKGGQVIRDLSTQRTW
ncbi:hypothetical protein RvY_05094 [Ramazzottius varieornatus]|uniref:TSEN34 N-terminal domain-containing protein n=1 Tax=Ramazzottius varieornatus TaxID=947166 RepID=A0A1D1V0K8_RAMVA|nr:hypothetical protein RvY_05094 [Ramazzottius varieornatus]